MPGADLRGGNNAALVLALAVVLWWGDKLTWGDPQLRRGDPQPQKEEFISYGEHSWIGA